MNIEIVTEFFTRDKVSPALVCKPCPLRGRPYYLWADITIDRMPGWPVEVVSHDGRLRAPLSDEGIEAVVDRWVGSDAAKKRYFTRVRDWKSWM